MVQVNIVFNPYQNIMRVYVDGRPITNVSALAMYQSMPFMTWSSVIFSKLKEEVNDQYAVTYTGRVCESRILATLSAKCVDCRVFKPESPRLRDSAVKRLRKLHKLCVSGLQYTKFFEDLPVYSDIDEAELNLLFKEALPKLCFCSIRKQFKPLADLERSETDALRLVIAHEQQRDAIARMPRNKNAETYILLVSDQNEFLGFEDSCITEKATPDALPALLDQYLELGFFLRVLHKALSAVSIDPDNVEYPNVACLDKIEPYTCVVLPRTVEVNEKIPIKRYTIPEGYEPDKVQYRISNTEVIQIENDTLHCLGTGEVIVETYLAGQNVCLNRTTIVAHKRNRIQTISIAPTHLDLCVGDQVHLRVDYSPTDADNSASIRFLSDNGLIASVIDGVVTARKPGSTIIRVQTDSGVTHSCNAKVYPKLEDLDLKLGNNKLDAQGTAAVLLRRIPDDATLDELVFTIEPPEIAIYDLGLKKLAARQTGHGRLTVTDKRKSVTKSVSFEVLPPKPDKRKILKLIIGAIGILAFIYLWTR